MEKTEAREIIRKTIARLTATERRGKSDAIRQCLLSLPELNPAQDIMAYLPMSDEWNTLGLLADTLAAGKRLYVPRTFLKEKRMAPVRLTTLDNLRQGAYGILEPGSDETCDPAEIDFILLPARAFDKEGNRLGRGAGYYDRFLAADNFRAVTCTAGFSCQLLSRVPHNDHDIPVQIVVTETETIRIPH